MILEKFNFRDYLQYEYGISPEEDLTETGFGLSYIEIETMLEKVYRSYNFQIERNEIDRVDPEGLTDL